MHHTTTAMAITLKLNSPSPNVAVASGGSTIHAVDGGETLCGRDLGGYTLAQARELDTDHSDFCKTCAGKIDD